jgi:hypothetical protein
MSSPPAPAGPTADTTASLPTFGASSREVFREHYNRASFLFAHTLNDNPLFSLASLRELALRLPLQPAYSYWSNGRVGVAHRWDAKVAPRRSLLETMAGIEENDSLVMLKHLETDSVLGPTVREICNRVIELAGARMRDDVVVGRGTVLIASPGRLTSYHLDSDTNYLFQIVGDKLLSVFDQTDRTLTPHEELERYYDGDPNGARFKQERQCDARTYELGPGLGVHIPSMAPHWAQNREQPSIALSINFDLRSVQRLGRIYHFNCKLRRHGIQPRPPGTSAWKDTMKLAALGGLTAARRLAGRRPVGGKSQNT